jgi:hypothetical protein
MPAHLELAKREKLVNCQPGNFDQGAKGALCQFGVHWDGQVCANSRLGEDAMTANLATGESASLLERLHCIFPGNVAQFSHKSTLFSNCITNATNDCWKNRG